MIAASHHKMLRDLRTWREEIRTWQEDLRSWLWEAEQLNAALPSPEASLEAHACELREKYVDFETRQQLANERETALCDFNRDASAPRLIAMAGEHSERACRHERERATHAELGERHRQLVARWSKLANALMRCVG